MHIFSNLYKRNINRRFIIFIRNQAYNFICHLLYVIDIFNVPVKHFVIYVCIRQYPILIIGKIFWWQFRINGAFRFLSIR